MSPLGQGAGDGEVSVGDGTERASVSAASFAQLGVFGATSGVMLHGDASPVVKGVCEAVVAGLASHDDATLAGSLGDRRDPRETSQSKVVSP